MTTLPRFNRNNLHEARGMEIHWYDEDADEWFFAFIAAVNMDKGITIKDFNNDDGNEFLYCHNLEYVKRHSPHLLEECRDIIVALVNHLYLKRETTFNTAMWHFNDSEDWDDPWNTDNNGVVNCPF